MATLPDPEQIGLSLLRVFARFDIRPGQMLVFNSLHPGFLNDGGNAADYDAGIDWLETKGFLRREFPRGPYFLTDAGFATM